MKKIFCLLLIFFTSICLVSALGEYGIPNSSFRYVWDDGYSGAKYCGSTKNISGYEVHNNRWKSAYGMNYLESFSGKLSKSQARLINNALDQFDLEVGDIYAVGFYEIADLRHYYGITVEITAVRADGSYSYNWWGFSYYK